MNKGEQIHDMTRGPLLKQLLLFTLPLVLSNLLQTVYTLTDLAIVGHFAGSEALAAVSVSGQVTIFLTLIGSSLASGGQIYVAQLVGQERRDELNAAIGTILSFVLLCALVLVGVAFALCDSALGWLNTPAEALTPAGDYLRICALGLLFLFGYNAVCAVLRGLGEANAPTVFVAVSAGVNVVLDVVFVALLHWGAAGAAWATTVSEALSFVLSLVYLYRRRHTGCFDFRLGSFKINGEKLGVILKLALPLVLMQFSIHLSMLYICSFINAYGMAAASLSGVGGKLYSLMSIVSGAFSTAMATVVGQNVGAGQYGRVRKALYMSVAVDLVFCAVMAAVMLLWPRAVFRVFTNDEAVLALAPQYLRISVWTCLLFALMGPVLGLINGVGNTLLNMGISLMDGVVARIGLSLLLGNRFGMWGFFAGYCLAGAVSVILGWAYYFSGRWTKRKLL